MSQAVPKTVSLLPKLPKLKVYVQPPLAADVIEMLMKTDQFLGVRDPKEAEVIVWCGGADIGPALYHEPALPTTHFDEKRDARELALYYEHPKAFKVGVCRGAQFLNVMSGGKMWQHIDNHAGGNHDVFDTRTGKTLSVNSIHHQEMILAHGGDLLLTANVATEKKSHNKGWRKGTAASANADVEAMWYPLTSSFGVQYHPEWMPFDSDGTQWFLHNLTYYYRLHKRRLEGGMGDPRAASN